MRKIAILLLFAGLGFAQSPFQTIIEFSGMRWGVFTNYDKGSGNKFTKDAVYVDSFGYLHLKAYAVRADSGIKFYASGIISTTKYLYGVYKFETLGRLDNFYNTDFGPFLYDWERGIYEIDIEYSRAINSKGNPGNYYLHYMPKGKHLRKGYNFTLPGDSVHAFHYIYLFPDSIVLKTTVLEKGREKIYGYHVFKDKRFIPKRPVYMEIYLWWPRRDTTHEKEREIVIKSVKFESFKESRKQKTHPRHLKVNKLGK